MEDYIYLEWEASPDSMVVGYNIYRSESSSGDPATRSLLNEDSLITTTWHEDFDVESAKPYYYYAAAVNRDSVESSQEGEARAMLFESERVITSPSGNNDGGSFGVAIDLVEDQDGDDIADIVVGASSGDDGASNVGRAYLLSGDDGAFLQTFSSPNPEELGRFGSAVAGGGDFDDDGVADVVIAAPYESASDKGRVYVMSGSDGSVIHTFEPTGDATWFGESIDVTEDLTGDGVPDVIVGSRLEENQGRAYVFSGADGTLFHKLESSTYGEAFGASVAGIEDLDRDGKADVLVGDTHQYDGEVHVLSGATGSVIRIVDSPTEDRYGQFGGHVSDAGDLDNDGISDIIVSDPRQKVNGEDGAGAVYVFSGRDGSLLHTLLPPSPIYNSAFGEAAEAVSDFDGDGVSDFLVCDRNGYNDRGTRSGSVHIYSGANGKLLRTLYPPNPETTLFGYSAATTTYDRQATPPFFLIGGYGRQNNTTSAGEVYQFPLPDWGHP